MIHDLISIHDQYQFEIKLTYELQPKNKNTSYEINTYFFIPKSMDINDFTYTKHDFYNDIKSYIRLKTPTVPLKNLINGETSPFRKLQQYVTESTHNLPKANLSHYEHQLKLFCCIIKSSLRDHLVLISNNTDIKEEEKLINDYITGLNKFHEHFTSLYSYLKQNNLKEMTSLYSFADEYISMLIEAHTYSLLKELKKQQPSRATSYEPDLLDIIKNELRHRKEQGYPSIPDEKTDNEELIFRTSVLKKYMSNVLFLDTHIKSEGKLIEQLFLAAIAGLGMIVATTIAFLYQHLYGTLTFQFFLAVIIGYIFKDRIKEILRYYMSGILKKLLFDYTVKILSNNKHVIGFCKESFQFLPESKVEKKIRQIRGRDHKTEIENEWMGEKIILYRKRINIHTKKIKKIYHYEAEEGLTDIVRFNIMRFLTKMDNPLKKLYVLENNGYKSIAGERVYHLNMILKYSTNNAAFYKRFRIVLNRNGIKRIEKVSVGEGM